VAESVPAAARLFPLFLMKRCTIPRDAPASSGTSCPPGHVVCLKPTASPQLVVCRYFLPSRAGDSVWPASPFFSRQCSVLRQCRSFSSPQSGQTEWCIRCSLLSAFTGYSLYRQSPRYRNTGCRQSPPWRATNAPFRLADNGTTGNASADRDQQDRCWLAMAGMPNGISSPPENVVCLKPTASPQLVMCRYFPPLRAGDSVWPASPSFSRQCSVLRQCRSFPSPQSGQTEWCAPPASNEISYSQGHTTKIPRRVGRDGG